MGLFLKRKKKKIDNLNDKTNSHENDKGNDDNDLDEAQNYQQPEWMQHAIPVTRQETSGRISLLFYGPCYSGKSTLFKYIENLPHFKEKGAMIGVAFLKRLEKIKEKEVFVDSYDIGSYEGNERRKKWFIERCNLFIVVFDPTSENCVDKLTECINNIKNRENKDPWKICLCATKMDLENDHYKDIIEQVKSNFSEFKLYKLSKDSDTEIKKMYDEFIEESYDDIKDTLHGIDDMDVYDI